MSESPFADTADAWESPRSSGAVHRGRGPHGQQEAGHADLARHHQVNLLWSHLDAPP